MCRQPTLLCFASSAPNRRARSRPLFSSTTRINSVCREGAWMSVATDEPFAHHSTERMDGPSSYVLRQAKKSQSGRDDLEKIQSSATLYVGNLSFFTTEEQIFELFSKAGEIKHIVMGLDRYNKTPCGFCFVEYHTHGEALECVRYLNFTKLDDRVIRVDLDPGFKEGRQYGRGTSGGQVRDEVRHDYDPGRGGYGKRSAPEDDPNAMMT